jgi:hypothetical protein
MNNLISRNSQPLTINQIAQYAPSALAMEKYSDRSDRYTYIPTISVIEGMQKAGFLPFAATQSRTRIEGKREHTKHMIRFRHQSSLEALVVGDSLAEVILVNSHDGTSAYKLMAGVFRLVCSNGMIVADSMQDSISIRHSGNVIDAVIEGSNRITEGAPKMLKAVSEWSGVTLNDGEQLAFAEAAHSVRFADAEGKLNTPITAAMLLKPRRHQDDEPTLWHTMNRIQENVIKGGLSAVGKDANGHRRRTTTREIKGIDQDVKLNRALWTLAERMAELKAA